jgi:ABC-type uncharacterized transport system fused permease/ATPase subunit
MITNSKISKYNLVYKFIDDYSYLVSHVSVSVAGGVIFGIPGVVVGLGVSIGNDFLIDNNYIKSKSLTHGFVGLVLGYNVYPSWISGLIGVCGSISLSQGWLKDYHSEITHLLATTILGAKMHGLPGALFGGGLTVVDQILVHTNMTSKYYFSYSLLGATSVSAVFGKSTIPNSIGVALGLILANNTNHMPSPLQSIEISKDLYKMYLRIISQEQLDNYVQESIITLLSSQIVITQLNIALLKYQQNSRYQFEHMNEPNNNAVSKLTMITAKFGLFLVPYVFTELISNIASNFYSTKLYIEVDDALRNTLFTNETALKLSFDRNSTVLIDNLRSDSRVISYTGSKLIINSITKSINGAYGIGVLIVNVPELLVYSILYNKGTEYISKMLADCLSEYEVLIKTQESTISSLFKHDMNNIKIITEVGGVRYSHNQLQFEHDQLRESELIKDQIAYLMTAWRSFESITDFVFTYYLVGYKVGQGLIEFDNRINVHASCLQISQLLAWNGKNSQEIKTLYQSTERLDAFLNKTLSDNNSINSIDNIKREQCSDDEILVLSNLDIIVANKKLIHVDYLKLEFGSKYVITGSPGSGKSSLITKIAGIIANNIGGEGSICYPRNVKISLINQQDYFPLNKNMQEIIFYPRDVKEEKIALAQQLLLRADLIQFKLNQTEDWYSVLSGGQKQIIRIISAIMQEPNVLILDEVFNGLDKKSIEVMQTIIVEKLPNILVISIDHSALENNSTGFYTDSLVVDEGKLVDSYKNSNYKDGYSSDESFEQVMYHDQKCYDYDY